MIKQKSLKINFIMNSILTMSSFIFPLITFPYVSRILLPAGTGKVSFVTSIMSYFALVAQMGIPTYGVRYCAKIRDDKYKLSQAVQEIFLLNLLLTIISYGVFGLMLISIPSFWEEKALFIIMSSMMLFNVIGMEWLYKALEQYTYITIRSILFKFAALIATFIFIHEQQDYIAYGAITIFASSASSVYNFINARKIISWRPVGGYNFRRHLKPIFIFWGLTCAASVYVNLDIVMLGLMKTEVDVGYYNAAVKIKVILVSIVTSLGVVLLPRSSYYLEKNLKKEFYEITSKALNFVMLTAVPLMVYFMIFAEEGILFLSGDAYQGSILPMQVIMPALLFIGMSNITGMQILVPLGKESIVLYSEIVGAIIDLLLNILLIPALASTGAAIGTLAAEAAVWGVQVLYLKSDIGKMYHKIKFKAILGGIAAASFGSVWIKCLGLGDFLTLLLSAGLFFLLYGIVLLAAKEPFVNETVLYLLHKFKQ